MSNPNLPTTAECQIKMMVAITDAIEEAFEFTQMRIEQFTTKVSEQGIHITVTAKFDKSLDADQREALDELVVSVINDTFGFPEFDVTVRGTGLTVVAHRYDL